MHLPLAGTEVAERHETAALTSVGGTESLLIVEDEPAVRRLISRTLCDRGYDVATLESTEEALAMSDAELGRFQLILSDYRLTGADGLTLLSALKERVPHVKRILMSGYVAADSDTLARSTDAFLGKPFTPDGLARKVRETLDR